MTNHSKSKLTNGVLKALTIFGGVQVISIICSVIRTKLIAIWIGAAGVGLFGIYNSAIELLNVIFNLGLRDSAVRDIAASKESSISKLIIIVRRWALILGIIGAIITVILSPLLSNITFNDNEHYWAFMAIAFIILLSSIQNGELAILQGSKRLKQLAKASIWGAIIGVLASIPMFYFWKIDSVIPALITFSLATTIAILSQRVKNKEPRPSISLKSTLQSGRSFIILGTFLTVSAIVNHLASYLFMSYLNHAGNTAIVGHYQAAFTLINKYMGIIFTAIIMEYYPRLSQVSNSQMRTSTFVSHEMSIALWIILPVIAIFIAASQLIIEILYSSEFLIITPFIIWGVIGTIFRAISWCMAFVILARGDGKIYLLTETLSAITSITLNIIAYNHWGLNGLGIAYVLWYITYTIIIGCVYHYRYNLKLGKGTLQLITISSLIALVCAISYFYIGWYISAVIGIILLPIAFYRLLLRKRSKQQANSYH